MKVILISETRLEELFQATLDKLKLDQFTGGCNTNMPPSRDMMMHTDTMHRRFHYHVCEFVANLKKSEL